MLSVRLSEEEWNIYHKLLHECKCYRDGFSASFRALLVKLNGGMAEALMRDYIAALKRDEEKFSDEEDEAEEEEPGDIGLIERFP